MKTHNEWGDPIIMEYEEGRLKLINHKTGDSIILNTPALIKLEKLLKKITLEDLEEVVHDETNG